MLNRKSTILTLSYTFVAANAFVYLFLMIAIVPYWQTLSGTEIQDWFIDHFPRFAFMMVPVHLLAIGTTIAAHRAHRGGDQTTRRLWLAALVTLLISQAFNFTIYAAGFNPSLQDATLDATEALDTLDNWDLFHKVRTASVMVSLVCLATLSSRTRSKPTTDNPPQHP